MGQIQRNEDDGAPAEHSDEHGILPGDDRGDDEPEEHDQADHEAGECGNASHPAESDNRRRKEERNRAEEDGPVAIGILIAGPFDHRQEHRIADLECRLPRLLWESLVVDDLAPIATIGE